MEKLDSYIGHQFQVYGVEEYELIKGRSKGMKIVHLKNGLGLDLYLSLDRNGDISQATYKGQSLNYLTPNGYVNSKYYSAYQSEWLNSFTAGFMTTAGLNNVGSCCEDLGEELPLHGSISNTPVESYSYQVNKDEIIFESLTLDEGIFSRKLSLKRQIILSRLTNSFIIKDTIRNNGDKKEPIEYLAHINIGYPLLTEQSLLYINSSKVLPRNDYASKDLQNYLTITPPTPQCIEKCYYHTMKDKLGRVAIYNKEANYGLSLTYDASKLDSFTQWKLFGVRDYVLGLEPGNCYPNGRAEERKNGNLKFLNPDEEVTYQINVDILKSEDEYLKYKENK